MPKIFNDLNKLHLAVKQDKPGTTTDYSYKYTMVAKGWILIGSVKGSNTAMDSINHGLTNPDLICSMTDCGFNGLNRISMNGGCYFTFKIWGDSSFDVEGAFRSFCEKNKFELCTDRPSAPELAL